MTGVELVGIMVVVLLVLVALGIHIALALIGSSMIGVFLITGNPTTPVRLLATTSFQFLRDYIFAVIPLFILMGELVGRSGAAEDMFTTLNRALRKVLGRLAIATVIGNAIFATVTGVSIAAAAAFSRFGYPAMRRYGYDKSFAAGCIAGSSVLGMLIPPSILMIVWGILAEQSIGQLFVAGIGPGLLLAALFCAYIMIAVRVNPQLAPQDAATARAARSLSAAASGGAGAEALDPGIGSPPVTFSEVVGTVGIGVLMFVVLGGIWGGLFTPTEAAAIGAMGALVLAVIKGLRAREIYEVFYHTARITAPLLILLIAAQMYSRMLSLGGMVNLLQSYVQALDMNVVVVLLAMALIWLLLGMVIDSVSIMLLTVPLFWPIAREMGVDPLVFAIYGILLIEAGMVTPPFGIVLFTVRGALPDRSVTIGDIMRGTLPYCLIIIATAFIVLAVPQVATFLPRTFF